MCWKAEGLWQSVGSQRRKVPGRPAWGLGLCPEGNTGTVKDSKKEGTLCLDLHFRKITLVMVWKMG